jgi:hypothetical protein
MCIDDIYFKVMILGLVPLLDPDTHPNFNKCLNIVHRAAKKILVEFLAKPKETLNTINCRILYLLICPDSSVRHKADQLLLKSTETNEYDHLINGRSSETKTLEALLTLATVFPDKFTPTIEHIISTFISHSALNPDLFTGSILQITKILGYLLLSYERNTSCIMYDEDTTGLFSNLSEFWTLTLDFICNSLINTLTMVHTVKNIRHVVSQVFSLTGFLLSADFPAGHDLEQASESITRTLDAMIGWFEASDDRLRSESLAGAGQILRYVQSNGLTVGDVEMERFDGFIKGTIGSLSASERELLGMWDVTDDLFIDSDDDAMDVCENDAGVIDLTNEVDSPKPIKAVETQYVKSREPMKKERVAGVYETIPITIPKNYAVNEREVRDSWMVRICFRINTIDDGQGCEDGKVSGKETETGA